MEEDSYLENVTESDVIAMLPIILLASLFAIVFYWFLSLFGFSRDKPMSLRKQQRQYLKQEKRMMKEFN